MIARKQIILKLVIIILIFIHKIPHKLLKFILIVSDTDKEEDIKTEELNNEIDNEEEKIPK